MKSQNSQVVLALIIVALAFSACGPSSEELAEQTKEAELIAIGETAIAQKTVEAASTPTPEPSATFTPTSTPTATPTPIVYTANIEFVDGEGSFIPNAKIIRGRRFSFSDEKGIFSEDLLEPELTMKVFAQGYTLQEHTSILEPGENSIRISLLPDPIGLQPAQLEKEGYELVFVEDFQDQLINCSRHGNASMVLDDTNDENYLLLVDLRNLGNSFFSCTFGPTHTVDAIIEVDFRYVDIDYYDFKVNEYYDWQSYGISLRDNLVVDGYPIYVPWGATLQFADFRTDDWDFPVTVRQNLSTGRWYTLSTLWNGKQVEVRIDGRFRFNYLNAPGSGIPRANDQAMILARDEAYIQFDNIKMWIPDK